MIARIIIGLMLTAVAFAVAGRRLRKPLLFRRFPLQRGDATGPRT